jgi:hypothetical protein
MSTTHINGSVAAALDDLCQHTGSLEELRVMSFLVSIESLGGEYALHNNYVAVYYHGNLIDVVGIK